LTAARPLATPPRRVYTSRVPASPARRIAFDVLRRVSDGAYASELLFRQLGPGVSRLDAALATEITLGVLRWQRLLDFLLARHLDRPIASLDVEVVLALRIGLYQLRYLERVPAHAAVGEAVELAKRGRKHSAAPFVNAVLRHAAPEAKISGARLEHLLGRDTSPAERAATLHSHPTWLVERWMAAFGPEQTMALLDANNRAPRLSCAVLAPNDPQAIAGELRAAGLEVMPGRWLRRAFALSGGNPTQAPPFRRGQISLQDEASQMVAHLAGAAPGETALDLCAAPGGKATLMARAIAPGGTLIAADLHAHRLRAMAEQFERTNTSNVSLMALDATRPLPFAADLTRILLDAPCSGTGTLARNPEIRWRLASADLLDAQSQQSAMLRNALALLAPGGRLIYSTCSLEPEENEQVVERAVAQTSGMHVVSTLSALAPHLRSPDHGATLFDSHGFFRTFPPATLTDGFFAAAFERRA
jgi:16S rRNA (cytosine967-C5)-methyltransferase